MLLGVDVGGTFTDAVLLHGDGRLQTAKVPSTPHEEAIGVLAAIEEVLAAAGADPRSIARFAHGMTVATNALLEGNLARTALLATDGFTDLVELGRQARPHLYRLCEAPPRPLCPPCLRFGVPERCGPDGVLVPLREQAAREIAARLAEADVDAVAVVLLHSYAHPEHERLLGETITAALPDIHISLSHELVGTFREYERAASTEIDAALSPLLAGYLRDLSEQAIAVGAPEPQVMQSSGGLMDATRAARHAALTVLSGPAGGVGGALRLAELAGERDLLCFDMGGTSCDVCLITDGSVAETAQRTVAGRPLALPALDIHTVGAGGGSIAWRDPGGALRVGPRSAGAVPGPACYGRGGQDPTVTDANLLLGRLLPDAPLAGGITLQMQAAERAVGRLAGSLGLDVIACAEGIVRVAEAEMLRALRVMSVERGLDPRGMALMAFGGAGPLHAAALARELSIRRILCPRASGVLCALGLAAAPERRDAARTVMLSGDELSAQAVQAASEELIARVAAELGGDLPLEGGGPGRPALRVAAEMRYRGQSFELAVQAREGFDPAHLREAFEREHERRYGYRDRSAEVELVTLRVSAVGMSPEVDLRGGSERGLRRETRTVIVDGESLQAECMRGELPPGAVIAGPAVCALPEATLFVPPGWNGSVDAHGTTILRLGA